MPDRAYVQSHPWIKFRVDLDHASSQFWMLLGEARSKCDHIKFVPLREDTARALNLVYFAKGVNATTAIEGNTLSEEQVRERLEGQLELPMSKEYLGVEIDNMIGAYNDIVHAVERGEHIPVSIETLCNLNRQILAGLDLEENVIAGELRQYDVRAGTYLAAPWGDVPYLLNELCSWLDGPAFQPPDDSQRIPYAFIKAAAAHIYLEWIHPFGDGNGRLGRLVEFLILIGHGVPMPAAHVLTSHYNDTRTEYYRQLNQASRNGGDLRGFLQYAAQGFVDGLTAAIKHLHKQQEQLMWQALVDDLHDLHTPAAHRQRLLAIELARADGWIPRSEARRLSPPLIEAYAGKTSKTLSRDVNRLADLGLVRRRNTRLRANLALVRGMRPLVVGHEGEANE